jgi:mono/diheme cytochrome c family protein
MKRQILLLAILFLMPTLFSFTGGPKDPWKVPEKYEKLKNPVVADEASITSGKEIFKLYCASCHGESGKGTGKRAVNLDPPPSDFTSAEFQKQSDGSLLYKVYFGHKDMPGMKKKLSLDGINEDSFGKTRNAGDLVNFMRTFGRK